jgi:hypothetical protein
LLNPGLVSLATLLQDVSLPIKAKASVLLQSTDVSTKDVKFLQQRKSYLQCQLYVCGYSLKHFFSLHEFLDRKLSLVHAEYKEDTEMVDDEANDIMVSCLLADNFQSLKSASSPSRRKFLLLVYLLIYVPLVPLAIQLAFRTLNSTRPYLSRGPFNLPRVPPDHCYCMCFINQMCFF